jgi:hypothetical protein
MITDFLQEYIVIYRLQGVNDYDFSASEDGDVNEIWNIVDIILARFDWKDTPYQRRADGIVDTGNRMFYVNPDANINNTDRIYRLTDEIGAQFFSVRMVRSIRDRLMNKHHLEIQCEHIDWIPPQVISSDIFVDNYASTYNQLPITNNTIGTRYLTVDTQSVYVCYAITGEISDQWLYLCNITPAS